MGYSAHTSWFCSIYFGPWQQLTDSYLGLRFQIGSQQHYGWARLDVDIVFPYFTIKDYAYEATPNTSILAGAGIPTTICNVPTGLSTINVLPNKAKLTWGSVANATKYKVYYKEIGSPGGPQSKNSIDNIRIINNLNPSTTYTAKVKAWCPGIGWSEVSAPITFTTPVMREGELDEGSLGAEIYSFHKNIYLQIHDWQDKITAQVAVFDMLGKRIYQSQINQQNEVIDLHSQPNGVYVVVLRVGGLVVKRRVFIGIRD